MPWTEREWGDRHLFFRERPDGLRPRLPPELAAFTFKPQGGLAQLYFQDPRVHYEAWFHWRTGRLELGLHFERDDETNRRLFDLYDRRIVEIKATLGESIELEGWDKGWARIYETWPCDRVDRDFRARMTERLAQMIVILQPIYEVALATDAGLQESRSRLRLKASTSRRRPGGASG